MKKFILILLMWTSFVYAEDIVDINELHTAEEVYEKVLALEEKYPNLIDVQIIGYSTDNRPLFVVVMTEDIEMNQKASEAYIEKMHFLIESGIHSRENPGPNVLIKMIEDYAKDYYNESFIADYKMNDILSENVIHFIPLSNPDGYNLSTRGLYTISKENQNKLLSYNDQDFRNYKANVNGVDLNRNFPGEFYDPEHGIWRNIWNRIHNKFVSIRPSGAYYHGPYEGSEVETQVLMDYMLKYDFRNYISFHSKGEVIYYDKWMLSDKHNERSSDLAYEVAYETGYDLVASSAYSSSSGYSTDYFSMQTLKPSITVETVYWRETLPVTSKVVKRVYDEVKVVPLVAIEVGQDAGYYNYKWYVDGKYVRDFEEEVYAKAIYDTHGGRFLYYEGRPKLFINDNMNKITRLEMIQLVMSYMDTDQVADPYLDCDDPEVLKAKALGIISDVDYFRPNDYATHEEAFVVLKQAFYPNYEIEDLYSVNIGAKWAISSLKVLLENNIIDYNKILMGRITLGELKSYLLLIEGE